MKKNRWIFIPVSIFLVLFTLTFSIRSSVAHTLSEWEVGRAFVLRMNDIIYTYYEDINTDEAVDMQNKLLKENSIARITDAYALSVTKSAVKQTSILFPDSEKYIDEIVDETLKSLQKDFGKSEFDEDEFREELKTQCEEAVSSLQIYSQGIAEYATKYRMPVILYSMVTLNVYRNVYGTAFFILLVLSYFINDNKKDWFKYVSITFLVSGIFIGILGIVSNRLGHYFSNHYLGRTIDCMMTPFFVDGLFLIISGIIVKLIVNKIDKKSKIS